MNPPLLYLWSRQDWTAKHKAIAQKCGHVSKRLKESHLEKIQIEGPAPDLPTKDHTPDDEHSVENHELENEARREIVTADHVESFRNSVDKRGLGPKLEDITEFKMIEIVVLLFTVRIDSNLTILSLFMFFPFFLVFAIIIL